MAGFLIQLTAVGTPMLAALAGQVIPRRTILAAFAALGGSILIGLDDSPAPFADASLGELRSGGHIAVLVTSLDMPLGGLRAEPYKSPQPKPHKCLHRRCADERNILVGAGGE